MIKTIGDYYYSAETGLPMKTSKFTLGLNFILRLVYKTAKAMYSAVKRISPSGIDNKIIIKE